MSKYFRFNRMEVSGSLGDLGTILPLALPMVMMNGLNLSSVFFCFGLYYIFSGLYFRVTMPVEPMKIIAAYAIASGISPSQVQSSALVLAIVLFILGGTGIIRVIGKSIPLSVIRGIQLSTGVLLVMKGFQLMIGTSPFQLLHKASEPYLSLQSIGTIPIGIIIGGILSFLTLLLLDNKKVPAAVTVFTIGFFLGILFHKADGSSGFTYQLGLPPLLPYGIPSFNDLGFALLVLVLPQIPMTIGNAIIANADLSAGYFPETGIRVTGKSLCLSMAFANLFCFFLGGIPMCHGAGGLASRYRFGARTGGSNLIIGFLLLGLTVLFGHNMMQLLNYIPMAVLGVLLVFAGTQLSLTLLDIRAREDLFVIVVMLGLTLVTNLAVGFLIGIILAFLLKVPKIKI